MIQVSDNSNAMRAIIARAKPNLVLGFVLPGNNNATQCLSLQGR
jgi:hypothetical protein